MEEDGVQIFDAVLAWFVFDLKPTQTAARFLFEGESPGRTHWGVDSVGLQLHVGCWRGGDSGKEKFLGNHLILWNQHAVDSTNRLGSNCKRMQKNVKR